MTAALINDNPTVIEALLDAGANINDRDADGSTALIYAAKYNDNPLVIHALLDANPDITIKDNDGKTTWYYMEENENLKGTDAYWRLNNRRFE